MPTTTDFSEWLSAVDTNQYTEVYDLYQSVDKVEMTDLFNTTRKDSRVFVQCNYLDSHTLILASEKAYDAFKRHIIAELCSGNDIETYYGFQKAIAGKD